MSSLENEECESCRIDVPPVTQSQLDEWMPQLPGWSMINIHDIPRIQRSFEFKNFCDAIAFTNEVGMLAEASHHHPEIITEWGKVTVTWWTHKIKGLHKNDLIMAAKTNTLFVER